jgi:hypothetical protein
MAGAVTMSPQDAVVGTKVLRRMSDRSRTDSGVIEQSDSGGVSVRWDNGVVALYHWGESMLPRASRLETR